MLLQRDCGIQGELTKLLLKKTDELLAIFGTSFSKLRKSVA